MLNIIRLTKKWDAWCKCIMLISNWIEKKKKEEQLEKNSQINNDDKIKLSLEMLNPNIFVYIIS